MRRLVPIEANAARRGACAPSPMATMAMTAATPMMMPSVVRNERSLLRSSARTATRRRLAGAHDAASCARPRAPSRALRGAWRSSCDAVPSRTTITRRGVGGDVGLVRDEDDGDALVAELLEQRHDLDAGARVEVAGRLVGEDERGAGSPARARSPRAAAGRPTAGSGGGRRRSPRPTRSSASRARAPPLGAGARRRRPAAARRSRARVVRASRLKLWNTKPSLLVAHSASSSRSRRDTSAPSRR